MQKDCKHLSRRKSFSESREKNSGLCAEESINHLWVLPLFQLLSCLVDVFLENCLLQRDRRVSCSLQTVQGSSYQEPTVATFLQFPQMSAPERLFVRYD